MTIRILPYNSASESAKALAGALGIKRLRLKDSRARIKPDDLVINWGNSKPNPSLNKGKTINTIDAVAIASNKKSFFEKVQGKVNTPKFTFDEDEVKLWFKNGMRYVVSRELLNSHSAKGVVVMDLEAFNIYDKKKAKMWVEYVPKKHEYRYHVVDGKVIDKRRKALRQGIDLDQVDWQVRNHDSGFIFAIDEEHEYPDVDQQVIDSVKECGLDFGAVDVLYNGQRGAFILEINTAPGLEGRTTERYAQAFKEMA